jgi:hypothetical protein
MRIYIHRVIIREQPRAIHPDISMKNPDFLQGYAIGLRNGLHPEQKDTPFTDEDIVRAIRECVVEEPDTLPYILGCYIGGIIASCQ